jgi:hypothetical protein
MHPTGCDGKEDHNVSQEGVSMKIVDINLVTWNFVECEFQTSTAPLAEVIMLCHLPFVTISSRDSGIRQLVHYVVLHVDRVNTLHESLHGF